MAIRTKKVAQLSTYLPKEPPAIEVPDWCPKLPLLAMAAATRGCGKSTAIQSMLRKMKGANVCHRVFLISPTYKSNDFLWDGVVDPGDVYEDAYQSALDSVVGEVESEAKEWKLYNENRMVFEAFKRDEAMYISGRKKELDPVLLAAAVEAGVAHLETYPPYKYHGCQHPCIFLVVDDCQSSAIFNSNTKQKNSLNSLCIRNRHIGGDRFGCSIIIAVQNWKTQTGALSKAVRMNMTCIMLWRYRCEKLIEDIADECGREINKEQFIAAYDYATRENKWDFLFFEFSPVRLRKNFDEFIDMSTLPQVSEITACPGEIKSDS
jgi:hypothetical protein